MINLELYIQGERVDLFKDETISLTSNIKDARDITKVLTDFTKQFSLPASKTNNRIFRHFYNFDIIGNNYDARYKVDAVLKINGINFRKGTIRLNKVDMRNGIAHTYKVVFFGSGVTLKSLLGKDKLSSLSLLNKYTHLYNSDVVYNGLKNGLEYNELTDEVEVGSGRDIVYPLISHTTQFYLDLADDTVEQDKYINISRQGTGSDTSRGIRFTDLKPAIKLIRIIEAIEGKYDITFSRDFFGSINFQSLYMWLHSTKGGITSGTGEDVLMSEVGLDKFTYSSNNDVLTNPLITSSEFTNGYPLLSRKVMYSLRYKVIPNNDNNYSVSFINEITGERISGGGIDKSGTQSFYINLPYYPTDWSPKIVISTLGGGDGITSYDIDLRVRKRVKDFGDNFYSDITGNYILEDDISIISKIIPTDQIPDMTIVDFLKNLFNMFNLTALNDSDDFSDDTLMVDTLDSLYRRGKTIDISKYIVTDKHSVERVLPYGQFNFEYEDAVSFLAIKRNELIPGTKFGNLNYVGETIQQGNNTNSNFDGGKYNIKVSFEHMLFEKLGYNDVPNNLSNIVWGWMVDEDFEPTIGKPLIFINEGNTIGNLAFKGFPNNVGYYNRPSNSRSYVSSINDFSINFGSEIDEYNTEFTENSLFGTYYQGYVQGIFDASARKLVFTAELPPSILLDINLNDILIINNRGYRIDKMDINLSNGKTKLTLLNIVTARQDLLNSVEAEPFPINVEVTPYDVYNKLVTITFDDTLIGEPIQMILNGVPINVGSTSPITRIQPGLFPIANTVYLTDGIVSSQTAVYFA